MSNENIKKYSVQPCCDVKEYLGVKGLINKMFQKCERNKNIC